MPLLTTLEVLRLPHLESSGRPSPSQKSNLRLAPLRVACTAHQMHDTGSGLELCPRFSSRQSLYMPASLLQARIRKLQSQSSYKHLHLDSVELN
jgi:hypothetical protein